MLDRLLVLRLEGLEIKPYWVSRAAEECFTPIRSGHTITHFGSLSNRRMGIVGFQGDWPPAFGLGERLQKANNFELAGYWRIKLAPDDVDEEHGEELFCYPIILSDGELARLLDTCDYHWSTGFAFSIAQLIPEAHVHLPRANDTGAWFFPPENPVHAPESEVIAGILLKTVKDEVKAFAVSPQDFDNIPREMRFKYLNSESRSSILFASGVVGFKIWQNPQPQNVFASFSHCKNFRVQDDKWFITLANDAKHFEELDWFGWCENVVLEDGFGLLLKLPRYLPYWRIPFSFELKRWPG